MEEAPEPKKTNDRKKRKTKLVNFFKKKVDVDTSDDEPEPKKICTLTPEMIEKRKKFLMSQAPDNVKRAFTDASISKFPPIPYPNHVLQKRDFELSPYVKTLSLKEDCKTTVPLESTSVKYLLDLIDRQPKEIPVCVTFQKY